MKSHAGPFIEEKLINLITVEGVAEYLRIPKSSVYKLTQENRIPCQKVDRHWRFYRAALEECLSNGKNPGDT